MPRAAFATGTLDSTTRSATLEHFDPRLIATLDGLGAVARGVAGLVGALVSSSFPRLGRAARLASLPRGAPRRSH